MRQNPTPPAAPLEKTEKIGYTNAIFVRNGACLMRFWIKAGLAAAVFGAAAVIRDGNHRAVTISRSLHHPALPEAFSGLRILHLSDLHAARFGKDQRDLFKAIDQLQADIAVITGDLIDRRRTVSDRDMAPALELLRGLARRMPTFRVDGNHEPCSGVSRRFRLLADQTGVQNVTGRALTLKKNGEELVLLGIPDMVTTALNEFAWEKQMRRLTDAHKERFCLALSHRPQFLAAYARAELPFVLCGHAHGGQIRLPLVGPLYAPEQGVFPHFTCGLHRLENTQMIVSRGLGNSGFPVRFLNHPELGVITLRRGEILSAPTD